MTVLKLLDPEQLKLHLGERFNWARLKRLLPYLNGMDKLQIDKVDRKAILVAYFQN